MKILKVLLFFIPLFPLFTAETDVPLDLIVSLLPENPVILEAGAQFGEDSYKMSLLWPKGQLHCFEPSPDSYKFLREVSLDRKNISAYQMAVSNRKDRMPFYLSGGASSLLIPQDHFNRDYFHVDVDHPIFVDVVRLDDWLKEQAISKVDFLWLDMEGNELNALKGLEEHLSDVTLIYTEVNIQRFWNGCVTYEELKNWLVDQGFKEIWCEIVPSWQGNALFLNNKKIQK